MSTQTLKLSGLHCTGCALNIDGTLEDLPGIKSTNTSYAKMETKVEFDETQITLDEIIHHIEKMGYQAKAN